MTTELSSIRLNLEQMRQQLIEDLDRLKSDDNADKEGQRAGAFYRTEEAVNTAVDLERRSALEAQKRITLASIEHALEKIDAGKYGICEICGHLIDSARMEALPYAVHCITCSTSSVKKIA